MLWTGRFSKNQRMDSHPWSTIPRKSKNQFSPLIDDSSKIKEWILTLDRQLPKSKTWFSPLINNFEKNQRTGSNPNNIQGFENIEELGQRTYLKPPILSWLFHKSRRRHFETLKNNWNLRYYFRFWKYERNRK